MIALYKIQQSPAFFLPSKFLIDAPSVSIQIFQALTHAKNGNFSPEL